MTKVRIKRPFSSTIWGNLETGDTPDIDEGYVDGLVAEGLAERIDQKKKPAPAATPTPAKPTTDDTKKKPGRKPSGNKPGRKPRNKPAEPAATPATTAEPADTAAAIAQIEAATAAKGNEA